MNKTIKNIVTAVIVAAVLTGLAGSGLLSSLEYRAADRLYQRQSATDGEIVVIGMDQYALDTLGPLPWPRSTMAQVIQQLNRDPETAPAVIGVDVLYVGESGDPAADAALADAAREGGNVVVAAAGTFGSELVTEEAAEAGETENFYVDAMALTAWDRPYDALAEAADYGHINVMYDTDGVLRHMLAGVEAPEGYVESFAYKIAQKYADYKNSSGPAADGEASDPAQAPADVEISFPQTDENGFYYLKYTGKPGAYYDGVSVADVLKGDVEPDYYAGKIVLIGPYAAGLQDEYITAMEHASSMYGIEVQANTIDALRAGYEMKEGAAAPQLILLFAVSVLALLWFRDRKVLPAMAAWIGAVVLWLLICIAGARFGVLLQVIYIPLAVSILYIVCVAVNYIAASREKRRITATFGRYVDPAVLEQLLIQGGAAEQLGGQTRDIAVLFVDIRGFTTMSEGMAPETVVEIINMYLTLTTDCIMRNHGTLDKFVGDCTMAFWNAPVEQEDCIYLACRAAMDMVEGSKALGEELQKRFGRTVDFGVGVNYGPAVIGNIGAPKRMDYTAIGDTVNTASRLESNAPAGTVYISRVVADALGDRAETTSLGGSIKLKGKAEGFEILTLDWLD